MKIMSEADSIILERLHLLEQKEGQLPDVMQYYRELLQIQSGVESRDVVKKPTIGKDLICGRLREGKPSLVFRDFRPDWVQVQAIFGQIIAWTAKDPANPTGERERLKTIGRNRFLLQEAARLWYEGHSLGDIAIAKGVDNVMLTSAIAATLKPFLRAYCSLLLPAVDQHLWQKRHCPICGGKPDFAYLDKERGARWLICSRCDAEWLFLRLACPFCGTQEQDALSYLTDDAGSHVYRLYVCDNCRSYIKAIDLRRTSSDVLLPFERIVTVDLDRLALIKGYKPGHLETNAKVINHVAS